MQDLKAREQLKKIYSDLKGNELLKLYDKDEDKAPLGDALFLVKELTETELAAVSAYSAQFIDFINTGNGHRCMAEWPYVVCGMRLALRTLSSLPIPDEIRDRIKQLNEIAVNSIKVKADMQEIKRGTDNV